MAATFASASSSSSTSVTSSVNKNILANKSRNSNPTNNNQSLKNSSIKNNSNNCPTYPVYANKVPKVNALNYANEQRNTNLMLPHSSQIKFNIDQLVWAKINNHPWWPCKIAKENPLDINSLHVKLTNDNKLMYFIEFFGSCKERVWTSEGNLFCYDGIESFKTYAQDQVDRAPTKLAKEKLAERFQLKVVVNRRVQWEQAIEEANLYLKRNKKYMSMLNNNKIVDNKNMSYPMHETPNSETIVKKKSSNSLVKKENDQNNVLCKKHTIIDDNKLSNTGSKLKYDKLQIKNSNNIKIEIPYQNQQFTANNINNMNAIYVNNENPNKSKQQYFNNTNNGKIMNISRNEIGWIKTEQKQYNNENEDQNIQDNNDDQEEAEENADESEEVDESEEDDDDDEEEEEEETSLQPTSIFEYEQPQSTSAAASSMSKLSNEQESSFNKLSNFQSLNNNDSFNVQPLQNHQIEQFQNNLVNNDNQQSKKKRGRKPKRQIEKLKIIINNYNHPSNTGIELKNNSNGGLNTIVTSSSSSLKKKSQKSLLPDINNNYSINNRNSLKQVTKAKKIKKSKSTLSSSSSSTSDDDNDNTMDISQSSSRSSSCSSSTSKNSSSNSSISSSSSASSSSSDENYANDTEKINCRKQIAKQTNPNVYSQYEMVNSATNNVNSLIDVSKLNKTSKQQLKASLKSIKKKNKALLTKKVKQSMNKLLKEKKKLSKNNGHEQETDFYANNTDLVCNGIGGSINGTANVSTSNSTAETYLIDRYNYAVRHIKQGLSVEEACNKYRISKGALLKCLSGGTAPRGKKTRLTEIEENEIVEWLIDDKDLKYNDAIHLVFEKVVTIFQEAQRPNPFNNGRPSMDWWYDFLSRHPQIMASKPDWLMRGKVNDQYIKDVQSGQLKCTKFRRALLSAIQYIQTLNDASVLGDNGNGNNYGNTAATTPSSASSFSSSSFSNGSSNFSCLMSNNNPSSNSKSKNPTKSSKSIQSKITKQKTPKFKASLFNDLNKADNDSRVYNLQANSNSNTLLSSSLATLENSSASSYYLNTSTTNINNNDNNNNNNTISNKKNNDDNINNTDKKKRRSTHSSSISPALAANNNANTSTSQSITNLQSPSHLVSSSNKNFKYSDTDNTLNTNNEDNRSNNFLINHTNFSNTNNSPVMSNNDAILGIEDLTNTIVQQTNQQSFSLINSNKMNTQNSFHNHQSRQNFLNVISSDDLIDKNETNSYNSNNTNGLINKLASRTNSFMGKNTTGSSVSNLLNVENSENNHESGHFDEAEFLNTTELNVPEEDDHSQYNSLIDPSEIVVHKNLENYNSIMSNSIKADNHSSFYTTNTNIINNPCSSTNISSFSSGSSSSSSSVSSSNSLNYNTLNQPLLSCGKSYTNIQQQQQNHLQVPDDDDEHEDTHNTSDNFSYNPKEEEMISGDDSDEQEIEDEDTFIHGNGPY